MDLLFGLICGFLFLCSLAGFIFFAFSGQILYAVLTLIAGFVILYLPTVINESL